MSALAVAVVSSPESLPSSALARRLADLCGEERNVQVDFLLHLAEFDRRRAWLEAGYGSLWTFCQEVLHLRESTAGRRIGAMKALRRFPSLEAPLRDGRLCLSTVNLLAPVLTDDNLADLVARAAFLSKVDTEKLVASIRPRVAPADGIRRMPSAAAPSTPAMSAAAPSTPAMSAAAPSSGTEAPAAPLSLTAAASPVGSSCSTARPELRPVSGETYSLRVTLDEQAKAELDALVALLSHSKRGDLAAVLREAIRCALEKHGKRKGAVAPERKPAAKAAAAARTIPMAVRREVWNRDGGCCAWTSPEGKRCGSTWKLQLGHLTPVASGGRATAANVRIECLAHNILEAVRVFGREHMAPFLGEDATPGGRHGT
jgi:hypothetical protein